MGTSFYLITMIMNKLKINLTETTDESVVDFSVVDVDQFNQLYNDLVTKIIWADDYWIAQAKKIQKELREMSMYHSFGRNLRLLDKVWGRVTPARVRLYVKKDKSFGWAEIATDDKRIFLNALVQTTTKAEIMKMIDEELQLRKRTIMKTTKYNKKANEERELETLRKLQEKYAHIQ